MKKTEQKYQTYVQILKEELIPAMGCTEPISLAYGASLARKVLNHLPTKIVVEASGSIIKNVKSVIVPHTHHLKGIKAAVCAGIIGGNDDKYLEVLSQIDEKTKKEIDQYIESGRDVALSDEVKSYIDNKISEVEKVEITELASDWILTYNNSVKKGDMVYLEFALSKQTSWSNGWNNNIAKISVLSNENTHELTLNAWEGKGTGEIWLNNGDISVCEFGMYGSVENTIVVNATFYIGEK